MNKLKLLVISTCAVLGLASNASFAAGSTGGNLDLTLGITAACTVDVTGLNGNLGTHSAGLPINGGVKIPIGDLSITCANGVIYGWGVSGGSFFSVGNNRLRNTSNTSQFINYLVETDAGRVGDIGLNAINSGHSDHHTDPSATAVTGVAGTGAAQTTALFINPTEQADVAGTYVDTIRFTVAWP